MLPAVQIPAGFELCDIEDAADSFWVLHEGELTVTGPTGQVSLSASLSEVQTAQSPLALGSGDLQQQTTPPGGARGSLSAVVAACPGSSPYLPAVNGKAAACMPSWCSTMPRPSPGRSLQACVLRSRARCERLRWLGR